MKTELCICCRRAEEEGQPRSVPCMNFGWQFGLREPEASRLVALYSINYHLHCWPSWSFFWLIFYYCCIGPETSKPKIVLIGVDTSVLSDKKLGRLPSPRNNRHDPSHLPLLTPPSIVACHVPQPLSFSLFAPQTCSVTPLFSPMLLPLLRPSQHFFNLAGKGQLPC